MITSKMLSRVNGWDTTSIEFDTDDNLFTIEQSEDIVVLSFDQIEQLYTWAITKREEKE